MLHFDDSKQELVYYTVDHTDSKLLELAVQCQSENARLVLIIPTIKSYTKEITDCYRFLGDDLLIYEINLGMRNNLRARANKYIEYHTNSRLLNEN
jgi:hypothetical protein